MAVTVSMAGNQKAVQRIVLKEVEDQAAAEVGGSACIPGDLVCSSDCRSIEFCAGAGPVVVDTCPEGSVCQQSTATCVPGSGCPSSDRFQCRDVGAFPDPYDCTRFHLCGDALSQGTNEVCAADKAYDSLAGRCSLGPDSRPCVEGPVPKCEAPGQMGPQTENPNIYYVCVRKEGALEPWLLKCPPAQEFVGDQCADVTPSTATSSPTSATTVSTTTGSTSTTTPAPFKCPGTGQYPDPTDCRKYYLCPTDLVGRPYTCQDGYHYDSVTGCVRGSC